MENFSCRTEKKRLELLDNYEFIPISHMILLYGQEKHSAAERKITKEYYCFSYKNKTLEYDKGTFFVGTPVAKNFLELLKLEPLPLFNPIKSLENNKKRIYRKTNFGNINENNWNELALELYEIIHIILMAWDTYGGILADILSKTRKYYYKEPFLSSIKSVNTIIKNGEERNGKKRNILEILKEFKEMGNEIKEYSFPLVTQILRNNEIPNYITSNGA